MDRHNYNKISVEDNSYIEDNHSQNISKMKEDESKEAFMKNDRERSTLFAKLNKTSSIKGQGSVKDSNNMSMSRSSKKSYQEDKEEAGGLNESRKSKHSYKNNSIILKNASINNNKKDNNNASNLTPKKSEEKSKKSNSLQSENSQNSQNSQQSSQDGTDENDKRKITKREKIVIFNININNIVRYRYRR
jgi:hypothetical protein